MSDEFSIGPLKQWGDVAPMPLADFQGVRDTIWLHCAPLVSGQPLEMQIDLNRRPVHLLSESFIDRLAAALENDGYTVTRETVPDGGWLVDWQRKEQPCKD